MLMLCVYMYINTYMCIYIYIYTHIRYDHSVYSWYSPLFDASTPSRDKPDDILCISKFGGCKRQDSLS